MNLRLLFRNNTRHHHSKWHFTAKGDGAGRFGLGDCFCAEGEVGDGLDTLEINGVISYLTLGSIGDAIGDEA